MEDEGCFLKCRGDDPSPAGKNFSDDDGFQTDERCPPLLDENTSLHPIKPNYSKFRKVIAWVGSFPVYFYRATIRPFFPDTCPFYPTCSEYALLAIRKHGVIKGWALAINRLRKCHPWYKGELFDPVPERRRKKDFVVNSEEEPIEV